MYHNSYYIQWFVPEMNVEKDYVLEMLTPEPDFWEKELMEVNVNFVTDEDQVRNFKHYSKEVEETKSYSELASIAKKLIAINQECGCFVFNKEDNEVFWKEVYAERKEYFQDQYKKILDHDLQRCSKANEYRRLKARIYKTPLNIDDKKEYWALCDDYINELQDFPENTEEESA